MPRLIKIDQQQEKQITHKDCGAVIGYFPNEVQSFIHEDYGGGSERVYYIVCPNCGNKVFVKR